MDSLQVDTTCIRAMCIRCKRGIRLKTLDLWTRVVISLRIQLVVDKLVCKSAYMCISDSIVRPKHPLTNSVICCLVS